MRTDIPDGQAGNLVRLPGPAPTPSTARVVALQDSYCCWYRWTQREILPSQVSHALRVRRPIRPTASSCSAPARQGQILQLLQTIKLKGIAPCVDDVVAQRGQVTWALHSALTPFSLRTQMVQSPGPCCQQRAILRVGGGRHHQVGMRENSSALVCQPRADLQAGR